MLYRYHCPAIEKAERAGLKKFGDSKHPCKKPAFQSQKIGRNFGNQSLPAKTVRESGRRNCLLILAAKNEGYTKMDFRGNTSVF